MASLTADQRFSVREEIGDTIPPSDAELDAIYERKGGLVGVVRAVWTRRLANFLANPATFTIPGDYAQSTGANMAELRKRLARYDGIPDDSDNLLGNFGSGILGQLVRTEPSR